MFIPVLILRIQRVLRQSPEPFLLSFRVLLPGFPFGIQTDCFQFFLRPGVVCCGYTREVSGMAVFASWLYFSISDYLITLNRCGALRAVRLRPTSFRNSLYTLNLNIFFIFPYISACRFLFSSFLSFSSANNIYGINPCLSLCFSVRWVFSNKISVQTKL